MIKSRKKLVLSITFDTLVYAVESGIEFSGDWVMNDRLLVFLSFGET